jgi:hypothetical protein
VQVLTDYYLPWGSYFYAQYCKHNSTARRVVPEVCVANADDDDAHGLPGGLHQRRLL